MDKSLTVSVLIDNGKILAWIPGRENEVEAGIDFYNSVFSARECLQKLEKGRFFFGYNRFTEKPLRKIYEFTDGHFWIEECSPPYGECDRREMLLEKSDGSKMRILVHPKHQRPVYSNNETILL